MKSSALFVFVASLLPTLLLSASVDVSPARAPSPIELRDQFGNLQTLVFPATNSTVLLIADRRGSEQVDQWVSALKPRCAGRAQLRGLAQLAGVPGIFHNRLCKEFQTKRRYPVMMDWSGRVCEQFAFKPGIVNVLIIDPNGLIRGRFYGLATESTTTAAVRALGISDYNSVPLTD